MLTSFLKFRRPYQLLCALLLFASFEVLGIAYEHIHPGTSAVPAPATVRSIRPGADHSLLFELEVAGHSGTWVMRDLSDLARLPVPTPGEPVVLRNPRLYGLEPLSIPAQYASQRTGI